MNRTKAYTMKRAHMDRRDFLKTGIGALASAGFPILTKATGGCRDTVDFNAPVSICVQSEGKWRKARDEVSVSNGVVSLKTSRASWVRITWDVQFSGDALVLGDAWERSYGNLFWRPIGIAGYSPWYFSVREGGATRCIGVKTGSAALCVWRIERNSLSLLMDVRCGCLDTLFDGRGLVLAELVQTSGDGDTWDVIHRFCGMMCPRPKLPALPFYGGNDWYAYYSDTSFDRILDHSRMLAECSRGLANRPFHTIDCGWQMCLNYVSGEEYIGGPYRFPNNRFKDMHKLADEMKALGVRPGIWCRPLKTVEYMPAEAQLRREREIKYLDPTHPAAREVLDDDIRRFVAWGYELIKWDFPVVDMFRRYGSAMTESVCEGDWAFYDRSHTSAEISLEYYQSVARLAKGVMVNACNAFSHLTAGVFASSRIGDDTSGHKWDRTVKYGVNTIAFRGMQHGAMYSADPDCVGVTPKIPWKRNREWLRLLQYSGMPVVVSVDSRCRTKEVLDAISEGFGYAAEPHETAKPIDWYDTMTPRRWKTFAGIKEFCWD